MKIAVVGSRTGFKYDEVWVALSKFDNKVKSFISGGAIGVDTLAERYAIESGIPIEIIKPVNPRNPTYYLHRNIEIITKADLVIAFWDGASRGTKFVIDYAKARGKKVEIISPTVQIANKKGGEQ